MTLNERIGALAGLVGLLLALVTLLTANRATVLSELRASADPQRRDVRRESLFALGLALVTTLVFVAGLPLLVDAVRDLHPLGDDGPVRSVFVIAWLLLLPLIGWQLSLARDARRFEARIPR